MKKRELPEKQKKAWESYYENLGEDFSKVPEEVDVSSLVTPPPLAGYSELTRTGGYRSIPKELVEEAARSVGYEEELPEVVVRSRYPSARLEPFRAKTRIVIPRRLRKSSVYDSLRHEFTHLRLGHIDEPKTAVEYMTRELEVEELTGGRVSRDTLVDYVFYLVYFGTPIRKAMRITKEAAKSRGIPKRTIDRAMTWVRNYIDRYGA